MELEHTIRSTPLLEQFPVDRLKESGSVQSLHHIDPPVTHLQQSSRGGLIVLASTQGQQLARWAADPLPPEPTSGGGSVPEHGHRWVGVQQGQPPDRRSSGLSGFRKLPEGCGRAKNVSCLGLVKPTIGKPWLSLLILLNRRVPCLPICPLPPHLGTSN
jgi:hypothetical protein